MSETNGTKASLGPMAERMMMAMNMTQNDSSYTLSRWRELNRLMDPRRNYDDECGYPTTGSLTAWDFKRLYDREAIAKRVVDILPRECWAQVPDIVEDPDSENDTAFEQAWKDLGSSLRPDGLPGFHKQEQGSPIWEYLARADRLSRIGQFGVIFLGLNDNTPLDQPIRGVMEKGSFPTTEVERDTAERPDPFDAVSNEENHEPEMIKVVTNHHKKGKASWDKKTRWGMTINKEETGKNRLNYIRCLDETLVDIVQYESNQDSPRFGRPVLYSITVNDPDLDQSGVGLPLGQHKVHWTRIIHIADNLDSNEIFGVPSQRPVLNRLLDLRKIYGGDAEAWWRGGFPSHSVETNDPGIPIDQSNLKDAYEEFINGANRVFGMSGVSLKSHSPSVTDPSSHVKTQLEAIAIVLGIPMRIFMGSERGELSSGQDADAWNERKQERRSMYLTPKVIVPFIDRLICIGILPEPGKDGYTVQWPDLDKLSAKDAAAIGVQRVDMMSKYLAGGADALMEPLDFLTLEMDIPEDIAKDVLERAVQHVNDGHPEEEDVTVPGMKPKPAELEQELDADGKPIDQDPKPGEEKAEDDKEKKPKEEEDDKKKTQNHLPGKHSQKSHGGGGRMSGAPRKRGRGGGKKTVDKSGFVGLKKVRGKWKMADGSDLPPHLPKAIPPAWTGVIANPDPNGALIVQGKDEKGRVQSVYSEAHAKKQSAAKFARVNELRTKLKDVKAEMQEDRKDPKQKDTAEVAMLIANTGMRPGSTANTGAEKQAFGATTIQARHVVVKGNEVRLKFVGKKGVDIDIPIENRQMANILKSRAKRAQRAEGDEGRLFKVSPGQLRKYMGSKDGGAFKPKDLRTAVGTETAVAAMRGKPKPKTQAEYKKAVREVATKVSNQLGNTPTVALQSYIDPTVFSKWKVADNPTPKRKRATRKRATGTTKRKRKRSARSTATANALADAFAANHPGHGSQKSHGRRGKGKLAGFGSAEGTVPWGTSSADEDVEEMQEELSNLEGEVEELEDEIEELEMDLEEYETKLDEYEEEQMELEDLDDGASEDRYDELQGKINDTEEYIQDTDAEIRDKKTELSEVQANVTQLKEEIEMVEEMTEGDLEVSLKVGTQKFTAELTPNTLPADSDLDFAERQCHEFSFRKDGHGHALTGESALAARSVMRTMANQAGRALSEGKAEHLMFTADSHERSRVKFYKFMTQRASKVYPGYAGIEFKDNSVGHSTFAIVKKDSATHKKATASSQWDVFNMATNQEAETASDDYLDDPKFWDELEKEIIADRDGKKE